MPSLVIALPDRLRRLAVELQPSGLQQPVVRVDLDRWRAALGSYARSIKGIPAELDRVSVRGYVLDRPRSQRGAVAGFIVSQIWGFGTTGYGPHRLAGALAYPGLGRILRNVRAQLADGDPVGAFRTLCVTDEIPNVGMAFASKFLYFADPHGRALILDSLVRDWLDEHGGVRLRGKRDEREYAMWLLIAEEWARALKIRGDELELVIFTDALPVDSPWQPTPSDGRAETPSASRSRRSKTSPSWGPDRVTLLGCVKSKLERRAPAKDLYISPLWNARRAYAEAAGCPWLILSAKHGVLDPEQRVAPYDVALLDLRASARRDWGDRVVGELQARFGSLDKTSFEVHAGAVYRKAIEARLRELGAGVDAPLAGLPIGRQLAWYKQHNLLDRHPAAARRRDAAPSEICRALSSLDGNARRIAAKDWPADLRGLDLPGLYSWWVDLPGAKMLTRGLGYTITEGRIYAGQTGATRWPSGKAGTMTLARRIGGNHLNGGIRGSTFRLTLAAILAEPERLTTVAAGRLEPDSEQRLSDWMQAHLEVAVHPFPDRDALADLETHVLEELDPPLNLDGRPPTAIRETLTNLRRLLLAA